jgi:hypothetical protein
MSGPAPATSPPTAQSADEKASADAIKDTHAWFTAELEKIKADVTAALAGMEMKWQAAHDAAQTRMDTMDASTKSEIRKIHKMYG